MQGSSAKADGWYKSEKPHSALVRDGGAFVPVVASGREIAIYASEQGDLSLCAGLARGSPPAFCSNVKLTRSECRVGRAVLAMLAVLSVRGSVFADARVRANGRSRRLFLQGQAAQSR